VGAGSVESETAPHLLVVAGAGVYCHARRISWQRDIREH
jgi:hypothetical protein